MDNSILKDKKVLVVGMGRSGIAAMETALSMGAEVSVQDSKTPEQMDPELAAMLQESPARCYLGEVPEDPAGFDVLILSPGVPPALDFIRRAQQGGSEVIGELELAYRAGQGHYIAITGTNGKTTTTTLVGEICKAAGRETFVVGNIGVAVLTGAEKAGPESWLVTEVSSFQLETASQFRPEVSAILNLTPDHLNRHGNMENYGAAKAKIFARQTEDQYCVINYDDKVCFALAENCPAKVVPFSRLEELEFGAFVKDGQIVIRTEGGSLVEILGADELKIPGSHNLENALAAAAIAYFSGIESGVIAEAMRGFAGVEHRIEPCGEIDGVRFVNDSKGTNPDASIKALEAMKENIILIAGGYDKKSDFTEFAEAFDGRVKKLVLLGTTAENIRKTALACGFDNSVICPDMEACVKEAFSGAEPGDVVLLSPACASWDMYGSFEERGEHFKQCVKNLRP